jgi:hypothetical protein
MVYVHKPGSSVYRKLEREAMARGANKFGVSTKQNYKYFVVYKNRTIHFGNKNYEDYTFHKNKDRRDNYRARHKAILKKDGTPAYLDKNQPAYWSYWILW